MVDDVLANKVAAIERALSRVREEYGGDDTHLYENATRQDAIILNLQRACQAAIDLAMHLVQVHKLGIPQQTREAFTLLVEARFIDSSLGDRLAKMVGFRSVAIHEYQRLNLDVVKGILEHRLDDLLRFTELVLATNGFRMKP